MNATLALAAAPLAHSVPGFSASVDPNKVTPGLLGFIIFAAIGGAVWLLMKSMNKQFRKVNFEEAPEPASTRTVPAGPRVPQQPAKEPQAAETKDAEKARRQSPAKGSGADSGA